MLGIATRHIEAHQPVISQLFAHGGHFEYFSFDYFATDAPVGVPVQQQRLAEGETIFVEVITIGIYEPQANTVDVGFYQIKAKGQIHRQEVLAVIQGALKRGGCERGRSEIPALTGGGISKSRHSKRRNMYLAK
ncbi:MAG: hypothetical protein BCV62_03740 [Pseudomonas sp. K35]|nr:MAG: hypothetical protein BCV62_03740 [Pseudomonas sp. K35]